MSINTSKSFVLTTLCPATFTVIFPVVAPGGTVTVNCVAVAAVIVAAVPFIFTVFIVRLPLTKFVPVTTMEAFGRARAGATVVIVGNGTTKFVLEESVWLLAVTKILPVVALTGTVVVIEVFVEAVTVASTPLNLTTLSVGVMLKLEPLMVTAVPAMPDAGEKDVIIVDDGRTVKLSADVTVLFFTVMAIFPVVAPAGTATDNDVVVAVVTVADVPLKLT